MTALQRSPLMVMCLILCLTQVAQGATTSLSTLSTAPSTATTAPSTATTAPSTATTAPSTATITPTTASTALSTGTTTTSTAATASSTMTATSSATASSTMTATSSATTTTSPTTTVVPTTANVAINASYIINLAVIWSGEDINEELQRQFYNLILPDIRQACPASKRLNSTEFIVQAAQIDELPTLDSVTSLRVLFNRENFLFIGLKKSQLTGLLETVSSTTTVPGYPSLTFHPIAPIPLDLLQTALVKVIEQRISDGSNPTDRRNLRVALFIDDSIDISKMTILFAKFRNGVLFYRYSENLQASLLDVKAQNIVNIVVLLPADLSDRLKVVAFGVDMFSYKYRWFFHGPRLINVPVDSRMVTHSLNITSLEFGRARDALIKDLRTTSSVLIYDLLSIWQFYLRQYLCNESAPVNTTFRGYSGVFRLYPNGTVSRQNWQLQIYRGLEANVEQIGQWSSDGAFTMLPRIDQPRTPEKYLEELKANPFRIVTIIDAPYVQYIAGVPSTRPLKERLTGMYIDLCTQIIENLGIKNYEFFLQEDNGYGVFSNNSWNGIMKTIVEGRAQLACAPMTIETSRQSAVRFTRAITSSAQSILYMTPPGDAFAEMFQFLQPLDTIIWLTVLAVLVFVAIVLAVMNRIIPNKGITLTLYDSLFFSFSEVVQGTSGAVPNQLSGRIVVVFFWFFTLFLLLTYIANYSAFRLLDGVQQKVESLQTLLQNSDYQFGVVKSTVTLTLLQSSTFVYMQQMYGLITDTFDNGLVDNTTMALQLMKNATQRYALIGDDLKNQYLTQVECNLVNTGQFYELKSALAIPIDSEIGGYINMKIVELSRTIAALQRKYFIDGIGPKPDCTDRSFLGYVKAYTPPNVWKVKEGALTLTNTLGIAMINIFGCIFALLLSAIERSFSRVLKRRSEARRRTQVSEAYAMAQRPTMLE